MHPADEPLELPEIWPPGTLIKGDFRIEKRLGEGGFGTVYLARHRYLGTASVIKRLREDHARNQKTVRKFFDEGGAMQRLRGCPHIAAIEQVTQTEDRHFILVMEYVPGGDLAHLIQSRTRLTCDEAIEFGRQIAIGLQAAHRAGLVHRDIKPQNILTGQDSHTGKPQLKLIDFGIAADHSSAQTTMAMRAGSWGYSAPEQWTKVGRELDGRTDLYSLGAVMYQMLAGQMPYPGATEQDSWIDSVKGGPAVPVNQIRADVPAELSRLIDELLAFRPEARPDDAGAVIGRVEWMQEAMKQPKPAAAPQYPPTQPMPPPDPNWKAPTVKEIPQPARVTIKKQPQSQPPKIPPDAETNRTGRRSFWIAGATLAPACRILRRMEISPHWKLRSPLDHAKLGDAARASGDFKTALEHYRTLGDPARMAALQQSVEYDIDERVAGYMPTGHYDDALKVVDDGLRDFPSSQRLKAHRSFIMKAKESQ